MHRGNGTNFDSMNPQTMRAIANGTCPRQRDFVVCGIEVPIPSIPSIPSLILAVRSERMAIGKCDAGATAAKVVRGDMIAGDVIGVPSAMTRGIIQSRLATRLHSLRLIVAPRRIPKSPQDFGILAGDAQDST